MKFKVRSKTTDVGFVRINKNHVSWVLNDGTAYKTYREAKYIPQRSLEAIASDVVKQIIVVKDDVDKSAKFHMLRQEAEKWLVAEGHIARWMQDIRLLVPAVEVMEA